MAGYSGRKGLSTGVHDRLYARVVAFENGKKRLVLISSDLIGFYQTYEPIRDAIRDRFDLKSSEIFLSSIHTHSGPDPTLKPYAFQNNLQYTRKLKSKIIEAVGQAIAKARPVQMGAGRGYKPGRLKSTPEAFGRVRKARP